MSLHHRRLPFARRLRRLALRRDRYRCVKCGSVDIDSLEVDHVTPLERGGRHALANLQTLCVSCHIAKTRIENTAKADRREWLARLYQLREQAA